MIEYLRSSYPDKKSHQNVPWICATVFFYKCQNDCSFPIILCYSLYVGFTNLCILQNGVYRAPLWNSYRKTELKSDVLISPQISIGEVNAGFLFVISPITTLSIGSLGPCIKTSPSFNLSNALSPFSVELKHNFSTSRIIMPLWSGWQPSSHYQKLLLCILARDFQLRQMF